MWLFGPHTNTAGGISVKSAEIKIGFTAFILDQSSTVKINVTQEIAKATVSS